MKLLFRTLVVGGLLAAAHAFAADAFEGRIFLSISDAKSKEKAQDMTYVMKGSSLRMDVQGAKVSTIMDMGKHEMLILMHEQKMYMVRPMQQGGPGAPGAAQPEHQGQPEKTPDIEATGKTEVICGYTCNQFILKDGKKVTEMWLAEGLNGFMGLGAGGPPGGGGGGGMFGHRQQSNSAAAAKWEEALKGKGGFPLRVISRDEGSKEVFKMEATKVEKGGVTEADFHPPEGYQQFQMPNLGDMFKRP